jgi:hypothetical protein
LIECPVKVSEANAAREEIKMSDYCEDPDERARLRARRKFQMDLQHNLIVSYEEGLRIGRLEGLIGSLIKITLEDKCEGQLECRRDGTLAAELEAQLDPRRQGKIEGKRQGIFEGKIEDARNMLAMGISIDFTAKITGLPPDKIQMLGD